MARDELKAWGVVKRLTHDNTGSLLNTKSGQYIVFLSSTGAVAGDARRTTIDLFNTKAKADATAKGLRLLVPSTTLPSENGSVRKEALKHLVDLTDAMMRDLYKNFANVVGNDAAEEEAPLDDKLTGIDGIGKSFENVRLPIIDDDGNRIEAITRILVTPSVRDGFVTCTYQRHGESIAMSLRRRAVEKLCGFMFDETDARIDVSALKELPGFFEASFRSRDKNDGMASAKDAYAIVKHAGIQQASDVGVM